ncbi:MAG TPA: DUF3108 domain-containing protein [Bryobacteraceae bacterium]|jgi:hypothetical protein
MKYAVLLAFMVSAHAEALHYVINWQSGLSLGEATLSSTRDLWVVSGAETAKWSFDLDIDASVPGFAIRDHYTSSALPAAASSNGEAPEICSAKLDKTVHRGSRTSEERITFDQDQHTITRAMQPEGPGGGKSDVPVGPCARDALAFLQFVRQELAQGRLAPQQSVALGSLYNVRLEFAGTETIKKLGKPIDADRIHATIKGPASELGVDILFAKDEVRTPVLARIPLSLGTFTVELAH